MPPLQAEVVEPFLLTKGEMARTKKYLDFFLSIGPIDRKQKWLKHQKMDKQCI